MLGILGQAVFAEMAIERGSGASGSGLNGDSVGETGKVTRASAVDAGDAIRIVGIEAMPADCQREA